MLEIGVSLVQWNALREIHRNPGSSAHQLAELTTNSDQAFGMLLTRLLRLGFIERQTGSGRANTHSLTESGKMVLDSGRAVMRSVLSESFSPLSREEREALARILAKLLAYPLDDRV
jgi:DNA-binding MarR family transcriptional regulator